MNRVPHAAFAASALALLLLPIGCEKGGTRSDVANAPADAGNAKPPEGDAAAVAANGFDDALLANVKPEIIAGQVLDPSGQPLRDAVVSVKTGLHPAKFTPPAEPALIDQRDKAFVPRVLPVLAGSKVLFKNSDAVLHNVYSRSGAQTFDLGAFPRAESRSTLFDQPGRVDVFCAIHTNMHAIVLVQENPYFATTDARGYFEIRSVPPGSYGLKVWTERFNEEESQATVTAERGGAVKVRVR